MSYKGCFFHARKPDLCHKGLINLSEIVKRDFPRVQINQTCNKPLTQCPLAKICKAMGFALTISPADTKMGRQIIV